MHDTFDMYFIKPLFQSSDDLCKIDRDHISSKVTLKY